NYMDIRGLQSQLDIARSQLGTAQKTVNLVETRFSTGLTNELDVTLAKRQLATFEARLPELTAAISTAESRLAVLVGAYPGERQGTGVPIHGPIWSLGPGAYWPFLDFGRLDALIDIQELRAHEFLVNYKKTILVSVAEVDDAIKQFRAQKQRLKDLQAALIE